MNAATINGTRGGGLARTAKRLATTVGIVAVLTLVASCASPHDEGGPDPGLRGQWQLQSATDEGGAIPLANQLITLTIDRDNTTTGRSTCSDYTAHVYGNVTSLWVTATLPRVQNCGIQAQLDIERRYIGDLNRVRTSSVAGGVLRLLAPGIDLQFHRALVVPLDRVVGHTWKLATVAPASYYATANPTPVAETGATIRFSSKGSVTGQTACNRFTAKFVQNAGEIVISHLDKTARLGADARAGCIGEAESADVHLFQVLTTGFTFLSGVGVLKITSPRAELTLAFVD
jgi:heat shock protein HslJ